MALVSSRAVKGDTQMAEALEEVTVTRPDGYSYTVQVNARDKKALEEQGLKVSGTKKMPAAKNKARQPADNK